MTLGNIDISALSSLILAISAVVGLALASLVVSRILRQQGAVTKSLQSISSREFHSSEEEWKVRLERQIADLNQRLTDTMAEFRNVNHLLVDAERATRRLKAIPQGGDHSPMLAAMDIGPTDVREDLIFVLTPFEKRETATYAAIVEAFENWDITVMRGDEERVTSNILRHIISLIAQAKIIIANVSSRNPNVMYELGIAHGMGKPVIMVAKSIDQVPFDLAQQRILLYTNRADLVSKLRENVGAILLAKHPN